MQPFIAAYLRMAHKCVDLIFKFTKNDGGFKDKRVKKEDIQFLFVRYVEEAWEADRIDPVEEALVGAWQQVDTHFGYVQVEKNRI